MSFLNFSDEDSLSKRQRQQVFRHTLDEQRRVNQELRQQQKEQQHRGQSHNVSAPRPLRSAVPGSPVLDDDSNRVIPGLELACSSTEAPDRPSSGGKQPYMSALSEMNGRPLHVRQKQFEKESQYRNMLRDQIEENKRRKVCAIIYTVCTVLESTVAHNHYNSHCRHFLLTPKRATWSVYCPYPLLKTLLLDYYIRLFLQLRS